MPNHRKTHAQFKPARAQQLRFEELEERLVLSTVPLTDLPLLSSNPNSPNKIFLDFDGHVTSGTNWNSRNGGNDIHSPAFNFDGDNTSYSNAEISQIIQSWEVVAEDFAPFNVDVTTIEPASSAFTNGGEAIRVVFSNKFDDDSVGGTGTQWFTDSSGGVAYWNSWAWTSDTPAWVFTGSGVSMEGGFFEPTSGNAGLVASHEAGHAFGLRHDSQLPGDGTYYKGHSVDNTPFLWRPIMGFSLGTSDPSSQVYQWSMGEYPDAFNGSFTNGVRTFQDDVAIIAGELLGGDSGFRFDDHGDAVGDPMTATELTVAGSELSAVGIIEQRTDTDVFRFTAAGGDDVILHANPYHLSPNLDVELTLYNESGVAIATSNPLDRLDAVVTESLAAGDYYVTIDGVGVNTPNNGYSDYGSLGQFSISGYLNDIPIIFRVDELPEENHRIRLTFSEDVSASLDPADLQIVSSTGQVIDTSTALLDASQGVWDLTTVSMPTGNYTATISGADVVDSNGNQLDGDGDGVAGGDYSFGFSFREPGDANLDGFVDYVDLEILQTNFYTWQAGSGVTPTILPWESGNFNGDVNIDGEDLTILWDNMPVFNHTPTGGFNGDFTQDGIVDAADIDYLYGAVNSFATWQPFTLWLQTPNFDLNQDGLLSQADIDEMIFGVLGTVYGDTDIDGDVDINDFGNLADHYESAGDGWATGDFDGDGDVDADDFATLSANYGHGT